MFVAVEQSEPITLRPYQRDAVDAVYEHLRTRDDNPCVVIPTGGGKTPVMATICRDAVARWGGRVLILAHVKELLEQAVDKLHAMAPDLWNPRNRIGCATKPLFQPLTGRQNRQLCDNLSLSIGSQNPISNGVVVYGWSNSVKEFFRNRSYIQNRLVWLCMHWSRHAKYLK